MAQVLIVFWRFLVLGLTAFGGPTAHIGMQRALFVTRLGWLDEAAFAGRLALAQILPGPTSSQVGMLIGFERAGWAGAFAAWVGFTLPAATLLVLAALLGSAKPAWFSGAWIHGVTVAVLAVVLHAVRGMAASLCPDWWRCWR